MFELIKWYADAVSAAGDYWVGYSARLHCAGLSLAYSSVLDRDGQRHSLRAAKVTAGEGAVAWRAPALGVNACWRGPAAAIRRTIYRNGEGEVDWECVLPVAAAEAGGVSGPGYVERLRLTIPPWRLPIRSLRWGRFLSERNSLIWIDWKGGFESRLVFLNGREARAESVADDCLVLGDGGRARFDRSLVIRDGVLGASVLNRAPGLDRIAPARMFRVRECKWRSAARLELPGGAEDRGWAIHELVTWP